MKRQRGFTLLELMVAMAIFAMLAVAGWQVFDGVNRARERAQRHADNLAVLQYAYLQIQQDMAQIIPYQAPNTQDTGTASSDINGNTNNNAQDNTPEPFMSLDGEHISFVRFADPDPRYQSSTSIQRIEYIFAEERLIRRQYTSLEGGRDSVSLDSVLLDGVTAGGWQAYLPELSTKFPSEEINSSRDTNIALGQRANTASAEPDAVLLPKGVAIDFTYQEIPITWQWALAPQPIPQSPVKTANKGDGNGSDSNTGNNDNTDSGSVIESAN